MNFKPQTPEEIATAGLIPAKTIVPFEVVSAEDAVSKKGNDMIVAELRLFTEDGKTRSITTYLMEAMPAQLFHFCTYCGLATQYGAGTLKASDCVGKTGYAEIGIKIDKTGQYAPQNQVKDFVRPKALAPGAMAPKPVAKADDHLEGDPY